MVPTELHALVEQAPLSASLKTLAKRGVMQRLRGNTRLIIEGTDGGTLYIVLKGQLRAFAVGEADREFNFGRYGPGAVVGEMSLDGGPRSANVEAMQASTVVMVTRQTLQDFIREVPEFAFELLALVIRRAREATTKLNRVVLTDAYGRLRRLAEEEVLRQSPGAMPDGVAGVAGKGGDKPATLPLGQVRLEMTQKLIAHELGCTRERVSLLVDALKAAGHVLEQQRGSMVLRLPLPPRLGNQARQRQRAQKEAADLLVALPTKPLN